MKEEKGSETESYKLLLQLQLLTKLSPAFAELNLRITQLENQVRKLNRKLKKAAKKEKVTL
tara:strand:- start:510 stop:692 length:183 start_codon:yes stop_codon:yes gene_type:complete